jgi:hypothetical protein
MNDHAILGSEENLAGRWIHHRVREDEPLTRRFLSVQEIFTRA